MSFHRSPTDMEILLAEIRQSARNRVTEIVKEEADFAKARVAVRVEKLIASMQADAQARFEPAMRSMEIKFDFKFIPTETPDNG